MLLGEHDFTLVKFKIRGSQFMQHVLQGAGYRTLADNRVGFNNVWLFMKNNSVVTNGDCIEAVFLHHTPKCH